ncbi:MAG TPA: ABC transporter permease [Anaerolineales bacterium]|nr:ABC transporter permease [Anaerolineales bacterium]
MSSRWKKVWADFWSNKTRTFLTILTIMVGTAGVGFISNLQLYMVDSMDGDFLSASPSEALISAYPMDDESVRIAREVPGVNAVEGRSVSTGRLIQPDGQMITIQLTAIENPYDLTVNTLQPVRGESSIPPLGNKEVLIESTAASLGYKPGELITVERSDGKLRQLRLAGYMHAAAGFPYISTGIIREAYVTPETMAWLGGTANYSVLAVSVADNPTDQDHVTQVARAVQARIERSGLTNTSIFVLSPGHHYAYKISQAIFLVMGILGWLTVLLSGFLIINTTTGLMSQQTRQIGIMKATGGGTLQIFGMYIVLILGFGLMALIIAIPLANGAARYIGNGMAEYLGFYTSPYHGYTATLIQQIVVALVIPLLAALWPMYNSVRITVREALTDYGISRSVERKKTTVSRSSLLIPRPMRLSLRNAFRRKTRLSLTLFSLVLGGAVFIAVFNLWASFDRVVEDLQGYFLADVNIEFSRSYRLNEVASMAELVPGVESVEGWLQYGGTLVRQKNETETQVTLIAPPSTSTLIRPILVSGRWLKPGDENAIVVSNYLVQMFPDIGVGDWLTIKLNGKESNWQVIGVFSMIATGGDPVLYANYEHLSHVINQPGQVYILLVTTSKHDVATQQKVSDQLEALYAERGVRVLISQLGQDEIQNLTEMFDIFAYFFLAMATLIALIGGLGLMSTMSINVLERTREIGVMRAIGASNWDIQSIVIVEGMVIGLISWVISILLSIPITGVMAPGVGLIMFSTPLRTLYGLTGIFAWLIGILVIGIIASVLPARSASRLTVRDTLVYE